MLRSWASTRASTTTVPGPAAVAEGLEGLEDCDIGGAADDNDDDAILANLHKGATNRRV